MTRAIIAVVLSLIFLFMAGIMNAQTIVYANKQPGADASAKITACLALVSGGGTCIGDFDATIQTISSTVRVGGSGANQSLVLDLATTFIAGSAGTDMFSLGPGGSIYNLHVDNTRIGNYSGNVVRMGQNGTCTYANKCRLERFNILNGTKFAGITTGNAIVLQSVNGSTAVSNVHIADGDIVGFQNGIDINAQGTPGSFHFVNSNNFIDVNIDNAVTCYNLTSADGDILGNEFLGGSCQFNPQSVNGILTAASAGNNLYGNAWYVDLWDYSAGQTGVIWGANTRANFFQGTAVSTGGTDVTDDTSPSTNNYHNFFANQSGAAYPVNTSGDLEVNAPNGHGVMLVTPAGGWSLQPQYSDNLDFVKIGAGPLVEFTSGGSINFGNPSAYGTLANRNTAPRTYIFPDISGAVNVFDTNGGSTTSPGTCPTAGRAFATCLVTVPLNRTEPDTAYAASCTVVGAASGSPWVYQISKGTASIIVTISNLSGAEARPSTPAETDCTVTR